MNLRPVHLALISSLLLTCSSAVHAAEFYCSGNNFMTSFVSYPGYSDGEIDQGQAIPIVIEEYRKKHGVPPEGKVQCHSSQNGQLNQKGNWEHFKRRYQTPILEVDFAKIDTTVAVCTATYGSGYGNHEYHISRFSRLKSPENVRKYTASFADALAKVKPGAGNESFKYHTCELYASESIANEALSKAKSREGRTPVAFDWVPSMTAPGDMTKPTTDSTAKTKPGFLTVTSTSSASTPEIKDTSASDKARREADTAAEKAQADKVALAAKKKREEKLIKCHGSLEAAKRAKVSCQ